MTEYVFAKCKDHRGLLYYLMAETVDEVYEYCDNCNSYNLSDINF